jgi:hypothetical protein
LTCRTLLLTAMVAAATPLLNASVVFQTGFETTDSPSYTIGPLTGQNGWCCTSVGVVENSVVFAGIQAVELDASGTVGQNLENQGLTYTATGNPEFLVTMSTEFMESATGSSSLWDVLVGFGSPGFLGQILVGNGVASLDGIGAVSVPLGVWNDYQLILNFTSQTETATVNGQTIGSEPFQSLATGLNPSQGLAFGINSSPGTDSGFWDNVSVIATTPEPSGLVLTLIGLAGAGIVIARTRLLKGSANKA